MKEFLFRIFLLFALLIIFSCFAVLGIGVRDTKRAEDAARAGVTWLLSYGKSYGNAAVLWALTDINRRYCHSNDFSSRIEKHFKLFPSTPVEEVYAGYLNSSSASVIPDTIPERYDTWLLSSLGCAKTPIPQNIQNEILSTGTATGYDLTHTFLALVYARTRGCPLSAGEKARDIAEKVAVQKMLDEESVTAGFTDLSSERAALLLRGGYGASVSNSWISFIAKHQNQDGGWGGVSGAPSNPHTTALSLWAIVQKTGMCPL